MPTADLEQPLQSSPSAGRVLIRPGMLPQSVIAILVVGCCAALSIFPINARAQGLCEGDEYWLISTRCISSDACQANLESPAFQVSMLTSDHSLQLTDVQSLISSMNASPDLPTVIYAHGNRFTSQEAIERSWFVYQKISQCRSAGSRMRYIVFSWPSEQEGILLNDVRTKAERTDAQGLYLAWLLRETSAIPTDLTLVGYSFGGRVVTGALHALGGGSLGGRRLPGEHLTGLNTKVGLIAAAIDRDWLEHNNYHGIAPKNMSRMTLMYNPRDTVLRKYWLLDPSTIPRALGAAGPMQFARRSDGTPLIVHSVNCSRTVGRQHDELDYFSSDCRAGRHLAALIEDRR